MQTLKSYSLEPCKTNLDLIQTNCCHTEYLVQTDGTLDAGEQISYTTYGVRLTDEDGNVVFVQEDISTRMEFVEEFIAWCQKGEASALSFADHIEDYLAEHV